MPKGSFGDLPPDVVISIYTSADSNVELARRFAIMPRVVDNIRAGHYYARYTKGLKPGWTLKPRMTSGVREAIRATSGDPHEIAAQFGCSYTTVWRIKHGYEPGKPLKVAMTRPKPEPIPEWKTLLSPSVRTPIDWQAVIEAMPRPQPGRKTGARAVKTIRVNPGYVRRRAPRAILQRVYRIGEGPFSKTSGLDRVSSHCE